MRRPLPVLVAVAMLCAAPPSCRLSPPAGRSARLGRAWGMIAEAAERGRRAYGTPGVAWAVTDRTGLLHVATQGEADREAHLPLRAEHLFEIGSISKSFTAVALLQLRDEGRFDPQAPIASVLPWFSVRGTVRPLTAHDLLTHTSGLPRDRDDIPSSAYQALAVRERSVGAPPGEHFVYSNIGYQILGVLLERLAGRPYPEVIRDRILRPLDMDASEPSIIHDTRRRLAVGYEPLYDDRPADPRQPLERAIWLEYAAGDGSIAATPADLAAYLRMLLNRGRGPHGRILSEDGFRLLTTPAADSGDGASYGYGLGLRREAGHLLIEHEGGMVGYRSCLLGDLDAGVGAIVLVNGPGDPCRLATYALRAARAALDDGPPPAVPEPPDPQRVPRASDYAGTFRSSAGAVARLTAAGTSLTLHWKDRDIPLESRGPDRFYAADPDLDRFLIGFRRRDGAVVELDHGALWMLRAGVRDPTHAHPVPRAWRAFPGHYRTCNPWESNFRIVLRRDDLLLVSPDGDEQPLVPLPDGTFRVGAEPFSAERLRLDAVIDGRALRANLSGVDYYRTFTP